MPEDIVENGEKSKNSSALLDSRPENYDSAGHNSGQPLRISDLLIDLQDEMASESEVTAVLSEISREAQTLQDQLQAVPGTLAWDIVAFRVGQLLTQRLNWGIRDLERWERLWERTTVRRTTARNVIYNPPRAYRVFLHDEDAFRTLRDTYEGLLSQRGSRLREDFLDVFVRMRAEKRPYLTPGQLEVFREAIAMQTMSPSVLAERMGKTRGYVSRVLSDLSDRSILWEQIRFSYRALNLQVIVVFVEFEDLDTPLPKVFTANNPWLYSIFESRVGAHFAIVNFILPRSWRSRVETREWARRVEEWSGVTRAVVMTREEQLCWRSYNYKFYDGRQWRIPSGVYGPLLRSGFERAADSLPVQILEPNLEGLRLKSRDIVMIEYLRRNGPVPIRVLRRDLRRNYNAVMRRYNELQQRRVITTRVNPTPLLAPGMVIALVRTDRRLYAKLCNTLSVLPEVYAEYLSDNHAVLTIRVPEEHVRPTIDDLNDLLRGHDRWLTYHGHMHFVDWRLPVERWLNAYGDWWIHDEDFRVTL